MKILMLSPENVSDLHGGAVHTMEVARAFVKEGHEVTLLSSGSWQEKGVTHISRSMRKGPVASTWEAEPLEAELKRHNFDLIYERQLIFGGLGSHWAKRWGCQMIFEINSPHREEILHRYPWLKLVSFWVNAKEKKMFEGIDGVVTTHQRLVPWHYQGKAVVGPWAVSVTEGAIAPPWKNSEGSKIILVAGSFQSWHGNTRLLPILKELDDGPWALALAGGQNHVRQATAKELQENLPFPVWDLGRLPQDQLHAAYRTAHVLLAPFDLALPDHDFYYSPFKILEALACSLPVVTNDYENLQILMNEQWCGQTVSSFEPAAWAQALKRILDQSKIDRALGDAYAEKHSWQQHVRHFLEELL